MGNPTGRGDDANIASTPTNAATNSKPATDAALICCRHL
jgi:hypothetical protein